MRPEPRYVERMLICMNCGVPIAMGDEGVMLWLHTDGYRACAWLRSGLAGAGGETYAAPTDWTEAEDADDPYGWWNAGYMTAEEARVLGGW